MPESKGGKSEQKSGEDEAAQAARERELRDMLHSVEGEKSGDSPPSKESPNDFVERKMREQFKK